MKILYYMPYIEGIGADRWIFQGWKNAFIDLEHQLFVLKKHDDWKNKILEIRPDILFIANDIHIAQKKDILKWIRTQEAIVFIIVAWPISIEALSVIKHEDIADVYFGEREPESMRDFERLTGRRYHLISNAADKLFHFPVKPAKKYEFDIVYLGAYLPKKKRMFKEILLPLVDKYRVGIFGPYWSINDNLLRAGQKICRKLRFTKGADAINRMRVVIPLEEENQLYSSAKVCLNFHEREDDGSQPHYIVNQRTFKIPACGGFEICDDVPALRKYFNEDELIMAKGKRDWFEKIDYYIEHEEARRKIQEKGIERALRDHTYHNRVAQVINLYDCCIREKG